MDTVSQRTWSILNDLKDLHSRTLKDEFAFVSAGPRVQTRMQSSMAPDYTHRVNGFDAFVFWPTIQMNEFQSGSIHRTSMTAGLHIPVDRVVEVVDRCFAAGQPIYFSMLRYKEVAQQADLTPQARQELEKLKERGVFKQDEKYLQECGWNELEASELIQIIFCDYVERPRVFFDKFVAKFGSTRAWKALGYQVPEMWNMKEMFFGTIPEALWQIPEAMEWYATYGQIEMLHMMYYSSSETFGRFCDLIRRLRSLKRLELSAGAWHRDTGFGVLAGQIQQFVDAIKATPSALENIVIQDTEYLQDDHDTAGLVEAMYRPGQPVIQLRLADCYLSDSMRKQLRHVTNVSLFP